MKIRNLRRMGTIAATLAAAVILSSCNRGYGCPTNFSLNDVFSTLVDVVANLF